jgi:hypothetical protein
MKAKHLTWLIALALIVCTAGESNAAARPNSKKGLYFMYGLTGGATGDLDSLDITGAGTQRLRTQQALAICFFRPCR